MNSEDGDAKALTDIEEYGCHILHVLEDDSGPCFSYSIGIEKTSKHPELVVTGLKRDIAHWIINEYNNRVRAGEFFVPDQMYGEFLGEFEVLFRPVLKEHYEQYFGWDLWLYGENEFRAYQLIWPSTQGVWPWAPDAPSDYTYFIPILCEPFSAA